MRPTGEIVGCHDPGDRRHEDHDRHDDRREALVPALPIAVTKEPFVAVAGQVCPPGGLFGTLQGLAQVIHR
jgi:hypothetical protein